MNEKSMVKLGSKRKLR